MTHVTTQDVFAYLGAGIERKLSSLSPSELNILEGTYFQSEKSQLFACLLDRVSGSCQFIADFLNQHALLLAPLGDLRESVVMPLAAEVVALPQQIESVEEMLRLVLANSSLPPAAFFAIYPDQPNDDTPTVKMSMEGSIMLGASRVFLENYDPAMVPRYMILVDGIHAYAKFVKKFCAYNVENLRSLSRQNFDFGGAFGAAFVSSGSQDTPKQIMLSALINTPLLRSDYSTISRSAF